MNNIKEVLKEAGYSDEVIKKIEKELHKTSIDSWCRYINGK